MDTTRGGPQSLDRLAANLRWYLLSIICCQIEQSSSSLSSSKLYCRCCGVRGREARKCGQAVCNALALHRGCPHGPQGSRRSEGLVHKSTAQGAPVARALEPGEFLQPLDYPSSLPAGRPRSPAPNRSGRWRRTDRAERPATRPISGDPDIDVLRRQIQALDAGVHLRRRQTAERRVRAFVVVVAHPRADPVAGLAKIGKRL